VCIKVYDPDQALARNALEKAFEAMAQIEALASTFTKSELTDLNRNGRALLAPELRKLLKAALEIAAASDGAFDPTIYPLIELWGFYAHEGKVPDSFRIEEVRGQVDYHKVELKGDSVWLAPLTRIDLAGIAKGYAVDQAVSVLKASGVSSGLVDGGGDIRVFGPRRFKIGVKHPRGEGTIRIIELQDRAVATSGDYENYFISGGNRYHHIIDPKTGYPARGCISVTVVAPEAVLADGLATAAFVLGPDKGRRLVESLGCECFIVTEGDDGLTTIASKGFP
jgi:thiamine biosynthesis lipoprotein